MKKRKSSFKFGRRRSRSLVGSITNEICSIIDKSLPENERLRMLTKQSLDNALSMAEQECNNQTDLPSFKILCSEQMEKIDSVLESLNIYSLGTSDEELTKTCFSLNEFSSTVAKLEEEKMQWDNLTDEYRKDLNREKDLSVIQFSGSFNKEEYEKMNFTQLLQGISAIQDQKNFQIKKLKNTSVIFKSCLKSAQKYMSCVNENIESQFHHSIKESPRKLIKQCIAQPHKIESF